MTLNYFSFFSRKPNRVVELKPSKKKKQKDVHGQKRRRKKENRKNQTGHVSPLFWILRIYVVQTQTKLWNGLRKMTLNYFTNSKTENDDCQLLFLIFSGTNQPDRLIKQKDVQKDIRAHAHRNRDLDREREGERPTSDSSRHFSKTVLSCCFFKTEYSSSSFLFLQRALRFWNQTATWRGSRPSSEASRSFLSDSNLCSLPK